MFEITQDKAKLTIKATYGHPVPNYASSFDCNFNDEFTATLALFNLRQKMWNRLRDIREEEYNKGFKDAKKQAWFRFNWLLGD